MRLSHGRRRQPPFFSLTIVLKCRLRDARLLSRSATRFCDLTDGQSINEQQCLARWKLGGVGDVKGTKTQRLTAL